MSRMATRQLVLDFLIKHPGSPAPAISKKFGWTSAVCACRMSYMEKIGEVRREATEISLPDSRGVTQIRHTYAYWAVVESAKPSSCKGVPRPPRCEGKVKEKKKTAPWLTVNDDPNRKPIPNQDGGQLYGYGPRGKSSITDLD